VNQRGSPSRRHIEVVRPCLLSYNFSPSFQVRVYSEDLLRRTGSPAAPREVPKRSGLFSKLKDGALRRDSSEVESHPDIYLQNDDLDHLGFE
jgi:hypothetical protein